MAKYDSRPVMNDRWASMSLIRGRLYDLQAGFSLRDTKGAKLLWLVRLCEKACCG